MTLRTAFFTALTLFFTGTMLSAQNPRTPFPKADRERLTLMEDTLALLGHLSVNDSLEDNRFGATRLMIPLLVEALKVPRSFQYPFERLKTISIQYAPDSTFRVFTWQLFVSDNEYRYYGAIQMNAPDLKLFPLVDRSFRMESPETETLGPDNWYGALYYGIRKLERPEGAYYLLFGYDAFSFFRRRKVMEVLQFDAEGKPVFGAPVIPQTVSGPEGRKRMVLEYTAEASVRLNWDETMGLIVFDHLIPVAGNNGEGEVWVPDGSYEAFRLKEGRLEYIPMLDTQFQAEPPRPSPVLNDKSKDILGRPKTKNG